jgi:hypothetical protein
MYTHTHTHMHMHTNTCIHISPLQFRRNFRDFYKR